MSNHARSALHPPGLIVLGVGDMMRYSEFVMDLIVLLGSGGLPPGSGIDIRRSANITENLNSAIHDMDEKHQWAWILGDDHRFDNDLLLRLLDLDADIAVPLVFKRTPPFSLVIMKEEMRQTDPRLNREYPCYQPYRFSEVPDEPFEVVAAGSGGMLVKRKVLDAMGYPYFESSDGVFLNEDFEFCRKARELGFTIMCDPHAYFGHIGQMELWPHHYEGQLVLKINHGGEPGMNEVMLGEGLGAIIGAHEPA